jgi:DNA-binding transcriptional LysR family regulator
MKLHTTKPFSNGPLPFRQLASELECSTDTIERDLSKAEKEFGVAIANRKHGRFDLTQEGTEILEGIEALEMLREKYTNRPMVMSIHVGYQSGLLPLIAPVMQTHDRLWNGQVQLELCPIQTANVDTELQKGNLECLAEPRPAGAMPWLILTNQSGENPPEWNRETRVVLSRDDYNRAGIRDWLKKHDIVRTILCESPGAVVELVSGGIGIGICHELFGGSWPAQLNMTRDQSLPIGQCQVKKASRRRLKDEAASFVTIVEEHLTQPMNSAPKNAPS